MDQEQNRKTLEKAIAELQGYRPDEQVWKAIDQQLSVLEQDDKIRRAIPYLPSHQPPADLWDAVRKELDRPQGRIRKLAPASLSAAAALLLLFGFFWWQNGRSAATETITYLQQVEPYNPALLSNDWEADEADIALVMHAYQARRETTPFPDPYDLASELRELNQARRELLEAIDLYGREADLIRQLGRLERERSQLVLEMAQKI